MHVQISHDMKAPAKKSPKKSRYNGTRRPVTIVLTDELIRLGQDYFPHTRHGSLSAFLDNVLGAELRKKASKIRGVGLVVPESIFAK